MAAMKELVTEVCLCCVRKAAGSTVEGYSSIASPSSSSFFSSASDVGSVLPALFKRL